MDRIAEPDVLVREVEAVLGRRVDQLERENGQLQRRLMLLGVCAIVAVASSTTALIYTLGAADRVAPALFAQSFVLKDDAGHDRGSLSLTPEGGSRIVLRDGAGQERLRLTLLSDGSPGMSFTDAAGRSRVVLGFLPDETANLVFADRVGRTRAVFGLMPDESSTLVFADDNGETRVGIGIDPRGGAGLTVFDNAPAAEAAPADTVVAPVE